LAPTFGDCKSNQEIAAFFEGYGVFLGAMSAICSVPGPHSVGLPVFSAGAIAAGSISFFVKTLPCEGNAFGEADEEAVERKICEMMNKTYAKGVGPAGESRCID
jgi:hypothetical protein